MPSKSRRTSGVTRDRRSSSAKISENHGSKRWLIPRGVCLVALRTRNRCNSLQCLPTRWQSMLHLVHSWGEWTATACCNPKMFTLDFHRRYGYTLPINEPQMRSVYRKSANLAKGDYL